MADYFYGRIEVGGRLRAADIPAFCQAAGIPTHALTECLEDGQFVLEENDARYGQFEELEELCRELGLPYRRQSDGKYEFSPEIAFWMPGMDGADGIITDHDGNMQVAMQCVRAIRDALREGRTAEALGLAEQVVVDLPELPPFEAPEVD